jgi:hypothetical protein
VEYSANWRQSQTYAAVVVAGFFLLAPHVRAQGYRGPRTSDGKPNLNGIWQAINTAHWDLESHAAQAGPVLELGAAGAIPAGQGVVEGGKIPYLPEALAKKKENFANRLKLDPEIKCYLPGVPRATYMPFPFQIFQTQNRIMITYEYAGAVRLVNMGVPTNFHSDALRVVERYTPMTQDAMMYEATIEDSKVFSRPWKISMPLYRRLEKNVQLLEFKCVEFVEDLLYGDLRKQTSK